MILFLIALIVGCALASVLLSHGSSGYAGIHTLTTLIGGLLSVLCGIGVIAYGILVLNWVGAKHQADIINREYGTNYTQAEVFYASNVIDTVRELDRKRVELSGDLLQGQKE